MIKLTINPDTPTSKSIIFIKEKVVIGCHADLTLPEEDLQNMHVQIQETEGRFIIINTANDPFATINGDPFGKRTIHNQDLLQIGNTRISFEGSITTEQKPQPENELFDTEYALVDVLEKTIEQNKQEVVKKRNSERERYDWRAELEKDEDEDINIEELAKEAQALSKDYPPIFHEHEEEEEEEAPSSPPTSERNKLTLKDYYLHEFDDELENWQNDKESNEDETKSTSKKWRTYITILLAILLLIALVAEAIYITVSGKSNKEEMQASEAVADIAMALAYAQHYHVKPVNQNWSDPEFLKANLSNVLSAKHSTLACIDTHGKFTGCPYILRVYTSGDMSQFVVLAQPVPSLHHWIAPKATIIVDSKAMEMRKITDLKALNRLLFVPNTLDGSNALEISALIKKGELIPLAHLTHKNNRLSFSPPKALAFLRPGAENYIYNAPRYYPFAENLLAKALKLAQNPENSHELSLLRQEIDAISRFPNLVLYSSEGLQTALKEQKALNMIAPNKKFLVAYMRFNDHGSLSNIHLLLDHDYSDIALNTKDTPKPDNTMSTVELDVPLSDSAVLSVPKDPIISKNNGSKKDIDHSHPLYVELYALLATRYQVLKPISDEMVALLSQDALETTADFKTRFQKLLEDYTEIDAEQQKRIVKNIIYIYKSHSEMPVAQFIAYIRAAGLGPLSKQPLKEQAKLLGDRILQRSQVDEQLYHIRTAHHFQDLEQYVREATNMLTLENLPEPETLMLWQNEMRAQVQRKVGEFLFSSQKALPAVTFTEATRTQLSNILKMAWVTDPDEYQFFLTEYDILASS